MNLFGLTGRKVIVTDGTRGLDRGIAEGLIGTGTEVVIFDSSEKVHDVAARFYDRGFKCRGVTVDLEGIQARADAFAEAMSAMGGLGTLVNCAGIQRRHRSGGFPLSSWGTVMNVNLTAPFELHQTAAREFMAKERSGEIINIFPMLAFFGGFVAPAYTTSKGAATQIARVFCSEWANGGISVNCIAPGYMDTEMNTALIDPSNPGYAEVTNRVPAHRWGTPGDTEGAVIFFASLISDYLNGAMIPADGGYLIK